MKAAPLAIGFFLVACVALFFGWLADTVERWFAAEVDEDVKRTFDAFSPSDWSTW